MKALSNLKNGFLAVVFAFLGAVSSASAAGYGLMVGIDNYLPTYVSNPLYSCVNDAYGMREKLLSDSARWPTANFTVLTDSGASKTAIRNKIANLAASAVAGDVVVYFHSSHGGQNSGTDTFLCTYNASYQDEELAADLTAFKTGVSVIIVIDACHSAGMFKGATGAEWNFAQNVMTKMQAIRAKSGNLVKAASVGWITAANYNEYSLSGNPYSLFVGYVLDGFEAGDANSNDQVTFLELFNYAAPLAAATAAQYGNAQNAQKLNDALLGAVVAKGTVVDENVPLAEALDATALSWTTGGSAEWYGQTAVSYDGADSGRSGVITHSQESWMQTSVTGPGVLSYKWKASSEKNYDFLRFYYDGTAQGTGLSGETNWTSQAWSIPAGTHTLKWAYSKDGSANGGSDCGWVDQVVWLPGYTVTLDAEGGSVSPTSMTVYYSMTYGALPTPVRAGYIFAGWWTGDNGTGTQVTSASPLFVNANHTLYAKWSEIILLGRALETPELTWTTGGNTNWFGQTLTTYDGVDAAQSYPIGHSKQTWMQTTVAGPATVFFWWKVSSESNYDFLRFYVDNVEQSGRISGESGWQQKGYMLPGGPHVLKWVYTKDGSNVAGSDCGWVDQLTLSYGGAYFDQEAVVTAGEGNSGVGGVTAFVPVYGTGPMTVKVTAMPASATTSDYTFPSAGTNLTWGLGESGYKYVTVPIRGDTIAEGEELLYLALGSPSGGWVDEPSVCTVVIADDETGSVVDKGTFVAGVPVPPEGGRVSGGAYCLVGRTVQLTATANTGWTFLNWDDGSQARSHVVTGAEAAEAALDDAMLVRAYFKRNAEIALPEAWNPGQQEAMVGVAFNLELPVWSECLPKVTVSGLPTGLIYNSNTVSIAGVPTRAGTFNVTFTASNVAGSAPSQTFAITVAPLPAWAQGTFNGLLGAEGFFGQATMTVSSLGAVSGKIMTGGSNYTFTVKSYQAVDVNEQGEAETLYIDTTLKVGAMTTPLSFMVYSGYDANQTLTSTTLGSVYGFSDSFGSMFMYRNVWKDYGMSSALTSYVGYYTTVLPGRDHVAIEETPDTFGSGYLTFTVDSLGNVRTAGKLADGTSVSLSGVLILDDMGRVFTVVYTAPTTYKGGCLFGLPEFVRTGDPNAPVIIQRQGGWYVDDETPFVWINNSPLATADHNAGFIRSLEFVGGWYDKIGNLYRYYADRELFLLTGAPVYPTLAVGTAYYDSSWWDPTGLAITPVLNSSGVLTGLRAPAIGTPTKLDGMWVYDLADNTTGTTFTFVRSTGLFSGTSKVWFDYGTTHTYKSVTFQGAVTPVRADMGTGLEGGGYFLWADKSSYQNTTGATVSYSFNWSFDFLLLSY